MAGCANDGSLDTFAKSNYLNSEALKLTKPGVIILPYNTYFSKEALGDRNMFTTKDADELNDLLLVLQDGGIQVRIYDDGKVQSYLIP